MSQPFSDIRFRLHNLHEDFSEMQEEIQNETENCLTESEPKVKKKSKIWISAFTVEKLLPLIKITLKLSCQNYFAQNRQKLS